MLPVSSKLYAKTMNADFLEIRQLGRLHFAINLRKRFLAAHRQDRVAEGDNNADQPDQAQPTSCGMRSGSAIFGNFAEPTEWILLFARHGIDLRHGADPRQSSNFLLRSGCHDGIGFTCR